MFDFDEGWYLSQYGDVQEEIRAGKWRNAREHYDKVGQEKRYNPNAAFDETWYLEQHPDVLQAVQAKHFKSGFDHYRNYGWGERRAIKAVSPEPLALQNKPPETLPNVYPEQPDTHRPYRAWVRDSLARRKLSYPPRCTPRLISFVTSAYNTAIPFLQAAAESILRQDLPQRDTYEWVIVDNGSTDLSTIEYLQSLKSIPFVRLIRVEENRGIMGGTRLAVQNARYRYVVPVDSDDCVYPDAARIMAWHIHEHGLPALLYSDEDLIIQSDLAMPYFKPDWDPVLFANSCYIAHLCAIDRGLAMALGTYTDDRSQGCHDWDTFMRFYCAGYKPVHVPEVLYSWRAHQDSCAGNIDSKGYIHSSHQNTLQRFIDAQSRPEQYSLEYSPLFQRTPDWWIRRRAVHPKPFVAIELDVVSSSSAPAWPDDIPLMQTIRLSASSPVASLRESSNPEWEGALVRFRSGDLRMRFEEWPWEAIGLAELFKDTVVMGGPIYAAGKVKAGGMYFGYGQGCDCPDDGRAEQDPGFFVQLWKQRSVDAVPIENCVVEADFLWDVLSSDLIPPETPIRELGYWFGAFASRWERRIIASPFLAAYSKSPAAFESESRNPRAILEFMPELKDKSRYYSRNLSRTGSRPYQPA